MRKRRVVGRTYGMKYSWKGHWDKNRTRTQEQNKKEWASSVGLCLWHQPQHPHHVKVSLLDGFCDNWSVENAFSLSLKLRRNFPGHDINGNIPLFFSYTEIISIGKYSIDGAFLCCCYWVFLFGFYCCCCCCFSFDWCRSWTSVAKTTLGTLVSVASPPPPSSPPPLIFLPIRNYYYLMFWCFHQAQTWFAWQTLHWEHSLPAVSSLGLGKISMAKSTWRTLSTYQAQQDFRGKVSINSIFYLLFYLRTDGIFVANTPLKTLSSCCFLLTLSGFSWRKWYFTGSVFRLVVYFRHRKYLRSKTTPTTLSIFLLSAWSPWQRLHWEQLCCRYCCCCCCCFQAQAGFPWRRVSWRPLMTCTTSPWRRVTRLTNVGRPCGLSCPWKVS